MIMKETLLLVRPNVESLWCSRPSMADACHWQNGQLAERRATSTTCRLARAASMGRWPSTCQAGGSMQLPSVIFEETTPSREAINRANNTLAMTCIHQAETWTHGAEVRLRMEKRSECSVHRKTWAPSTSPLTNCHTPPPPLHTRKRWSPGQTMIVGRVCSSDACGDKISRFRCVIPHTFIIPQLPE